MIRPTRHTSLITSLIAIGAALVATLALANPASARPLGQTPRAATAAPVAATPPMGWNDWYTFFCDVNEQLVEQTADAMVSSGMRDAGLPLRQPRRLLGRLHPRRERASAGRPHEVPARNEGRGRLRPRPWPEARHL